MSGEDDRVFERIVTGDILDQASEDPKLSDSVRRTLKAALSLTPEQVGEADSCFDGGGDEFLKTELSLAAMRRVVDRVRAPGSASSSSSNWRSVLGLVSVGIESLEAAEAAGEAPKVPTLAEILDVVHNGLMVRAGYKGEMPESGRTELDMSNPAAIEVSDAVDMAELILWNFRGVVEA